MCYTPTVKKVSDASHQGDSCLEVFGGGAHTMNLSADTEFDPNPIWNRLIGTQDMEETVFRDQQDD